jgi:hypothetical protein
MSKTITNEQIKLLAGFFNTVAAAILTTGVLGPVVTTIYGLSIQGVDRELVAVGSVICILVSIGIHLAGRVTLIRLIE